MADRQLEVGSDEIADWLRHPVTQWFFTELPQRLGGHPDSHWRAATSWEEVCRLKGQSSVFDAMREMTQ